MSALLIDCPSTYKIIDNNTRTQLLFEVLVLNMSLKEVCTRLGLKLSSAKNVLTIYLREGRVERNCRKPTTPKNSSDVRETKHKSNGNDGTTISIFLAEDDTLYLDNSRNRMNIS